MIVLNIRVLPLRRSTVTGMGTTEQGGRWDGWDDPGYQPTEAELNEPVEFPGIENATLEDLAQALLRYEPNSRNT